MRIQRILRKVQCKLGYHTLDVWRAGLYYGEPVIGLATCECGKHWQEDPNTTKVSYETLVEFVKQNGRAITKHNDDAFFNAITKLQ